MRALGARPDIYEQLVRSVAPSIWKMEDVKRGLLCQLFGGSSKVHPAPIKGGLLLKACMGNSLIKTKRMRMSSSMRAKFLLLPRLPAAQPLPCGAVWAAEASHNVRQPLTQTNAGHWRRSQHIYQGVFTSWVCAISICTASWSTKGASSNGDSSLLLLGNLFGLSGD